MVVKAVVSLIVLSLTCAVAAAQQPSRQDQSAQVKNAFAGRSVKKGEKVRLLLRDLSVWEGVVLDSGDDSFDIATKRPRPGHPDWTIPYKDVLELVARNVRLAFFPDPAARSHGEWEDVIGIAQSKWIIVALSGGKEMVGRFGGADHKQLTLLGHTDDAFIRLPRTSVKSVHGHFASSGGVAKATRKGMRIGTQIPPNRDAAFIGTAVGAGVGAIAGLFNRKEGRTILVFSR
jgi:hypothetical protein